MGSIAYLPWCFPMFLLPACPMGAVDLNPLSWNHAIRVTKTKPLSIPVRRNSCKLYAVHETHYILTVKNLSMMQFMKQPNCPFYIIPWTAYTAFSPHESLRLHCSYRLLVPIGCTPPLHSSVEMRRSSKFKPSRAAESWRRVEYMGMCQWAWYKPLVG